MRNFRIAGIAIALALALGATAAIAFPTPATNLQDVAAGKLVNQGGVDYYVVTVAGESPPASTMFALTVKAGVPLGRVDPKDGAIAGGPADFAYAHIWVALSDATVPTTVTTTGAMVTGQIATQGSNLWMKCDVYDGNGDAVSAGAGVVWAFKLNGGTAIQKVADDTSVTRIVGDFRFIQGQ